MTDMSESARKGIISMGNWIIDSVKFIDVYPKKGNLANIVGQDEGLGGCAHNVLADLAAMKSGIPLYAGGCIGNDRLGQMCLDECDRLGIDTRNMKVVEGASTSFTDVMSEIHGTASRTFFHCRGANALLSVDQVLSAESDARIFHLGYLLLLDGLDKEDDEYGVAAARALDGLQKKGYMTSVDVVSEEGDRYRKVVLPCLKYTDYLIINEVEAEKCLGWPIRKEDGSILFTDAVRAASELLDAGVKRMVVIHFPEGGVAASKDGRTAMAHSFTLSKEEIVSSVGAGDAFCAGALYAIHEGYDMERMLDIASASARFNLFSSTSSGGAPTLETILEYIDNVK